MPLISDHEAAKRLARAIASDLSLYNEVKVKQGIEADSFFELLAKEIEEGRQHYNSKVDPDLRSKTNYFDRALIDITSRSYRPKPSAVAWVREIRDLCHERRVAFFHKQWGGRTAKSGGRRLDGREWSEYPRAPTGLVTAPVKVPR